jgi:hypothetical protein
MKSEDSDNEEAGFKKFENFESLCLLLIDLRNVFALFVY